MRADLHKLRNITLCMVNIAVFWIVIVVRKVQNRHMLVDISLHCEMDWHYDC